MYWITRAWKRLAAATDGLKTLGSAALFFLLGVADFVDFVPVRPLMEHYLGTDQAGIVMMFLSAFFAALRFVSRGPMRGFRKHDNMEDDKHTDVEPF